MKSVSHIRISKGQTGFRTTAPGRSRRQWLQETGFGIGAIACSTLSESVSANESSQAASPGPHHPARAQNVIVLFMSGGPSQVDTFDPKPELDRLHGLDVPESVARQVPRIQRAGLFNLMASPFQFQQYGESGLPVSELFPQTARMADELCVIRSMNHSNPVHGPGECVALTGSAVGDRPSLGAWTHYALGSETENLPAFIAMNLNTDGMQYPQASGWGSGFLPAAYQGVPVSAKSGIRHIDMPDDMTDKRRSDQLQLLQQLNKQHLDSVGANSELEARIRSYEIVTRLQQTAPELFDLAQESTLTQSQYGIDQSPTENMGRACLLARRMVERGVRFVQLRYGGWDAHGNLEGNHRKMAGQTDQPVAALLADLKARGLLDNTLVVWGGEFGRTPTMEGRQRGRDHNPSGYTIWMAGGGVRGGHVVGQTDAIGYTPIETPVGIHDLHATILHLLGLDQNRTTYLHHGREEMPTVLGGKVVTEVLA